LGGKVATGLVAKVCEAGRGGVGKERSADSVGERAVFLEDEHRRGKKNRRVAAAGQTVPSKKKSSRRRDGNAFYGSPGPGVRW